MTRPLYTISRHRQYEVAVCTGRDHPTMTYYGEPCELIETVGNTTSYEAALAVLRLHGVEWFMDWTQPGANWDMPLTRMPIA